VSHRHALWSLVIEPRHGPYRAPRAAFDLQREADEAEAALADELVEIHEALHVREAEVAADVMDFEIVASRPPRAHGLDTKHAALTMTRALGILP
jgi:hypothetical protein